MWFIVGLLFGWLVLKQPEWSERQMTMLHDYLKNKLTGLRN
jgi:hypothetical protein